MKLLVLVSIVVLSSGYGFATEVEVVGGDATGGGAGGNATVLLMVSILITSIFATLLAAFEWTISYRKHLETAIRAAEQEIMELKEQSFKHKIIPPTRKGV